MRPEEKCVSRETGEKLLAAGFPQETERWWHQSLTNRTEKTNYQRLPTGKFFLHQSRGDFAAPDSAELGELLPSSIEHNGGSTFLKQRKLTEGDYEIRFSSPIGEKFMRNKNEAEARAAAWLYLKENNLL